MPIANVEENRIYQRDWQRKNKDHRNALQRERRKANPEWTKMHKKIYMEKQPWYSNLRAARERCNNPKHKGFKYYGGANPPIKCLLTPKENREIAIRDKYHELKRPSLDRIDPKGHYTFENCRYIELSENQRLGSRWLKGREN